jgi:hypothetical protein
MSDYIYRNQDDSKRFKIHSVYDDESGQLAYWDVDTWSDFDTVETFTECGETFATKKDAKSWVEEIHGKITSMGSIETVTEGWESECGHTISFIQTGFCQKCGYRV